MTTIIGIDCACDSRKVGIAVADLGGERASSAMWRRAWRTTSSSR